MKIIKMDAATTLTMDRRQVLSWFGIAVAALLLDPGNSTSAQNRRTPMMITCFIRYQIDPFQKDEFRKYAENWGRIIPRCGGHLLGYFLPYEGTNDIAWGLIAFDTLAAYERYRARLKSDKEAVENFNMAQSKRLILREERTFLEVVGGTFELPSTFAEANAPR